MDHTPKTIKLLEGNVGVNLYDFESGSGFLAVTQKHKQQKKKNKVDLIKIKI